MYISTISILIFLCLIHGAMKKYFVSYFIILNSSSKRHIQFLVAFNIQKCLHNGYRQIFYWPPTCFLFFSLYYCLRIYNISKICLLLTDAAWLHVWDKTVGAQKLNLIPNHRLPSNKWKKSGTYNSIMKYKPSLITNKYKFVWLSTLLNVLIYTLQVTIK